MPNEGVQRADLARRLTVAIATPILLLVLLGLVLGRQILAMSSDSAWVDHTDAVLGLANETSRQIIDQETGIRGYLLTEDPTFLEPFTRAHPLDGFTRLSALVADNPDQQARFGEARRKYETWLATTAHVAAGESLTKARSLGEMRERKALMDSVRSAMREAIDVEEGLRRERVLTSERSTKTTQVVFVGLLLASALVLAFLSRRQLSSIAQSFRAALAAEQVARLGIETEVWIKEGHARLADSIQGERTVEELGSDALRMLAEYTRADVGAFFTRDGTVWRRRAGYALDTRAAGPDGFAEGEGIIGRVALQKTLLHLEQVPPDFFKLRSGTGETAPTALVVVPAVVDGVSNAVLELGFLRAPEPRALELLGRLRETIGLAVRSSQYKRQLQDLLEEAQRQAEELQTQQEELRVTNEELEEQTTALRSTQRQLETQQAELEQTNDHLVQQTALLERQNEVLGATKLDIVNKARDLERASQFKSQFLSNMSHELRTPLNSCLILAKLLADNKEGNLTAEQVHFAETISAAGHDLLALINDILDLSKIESGKMDVHAASVPLQKFRESLLGTFQPVADEKKLRLVVTLSPALPATMVTDAPRLEQILKNLVSNALKFTDKGEVVVDVAPRGDRILFVVRDTGVGIPSDQQRLIFEAFRQGDAAYNRKFGGTGLGLSISRELARLLGGDIQVVSEAGKGSAFTLSLPQEYAGPASDAEESPRPSPPRTAPAPREDAAPSDSPAPSAVLDGRRILLIVEDDEPFAHVLDDVAREAGFQGLIAATALQGFRLAKKHPPAGVILDINLPDHSGLSLLDRLKRDPATRHVPVHVVSGGDYAETALTMGAAGYLMKPVQREQLMQALETLDARSTGRQRRVLVVDDDEKLRGSLAALLGRDDVQISTAATVVDAVALLSSQAFDCVVTDLGLPGANGHDLLETLATQEPRYSHPPIIVYTGRALTPEEEQRLRRYSASIIVKGARSPERLLDEVTLFLHQVEGELTSDQQKLLKRARHREAVFEGRTVLVVEDDVRNVYALSSALEPKGMRVVIARNGREALAALDRHPDVDVVLMDLMMPEMDGLEATREIRKQPRWAKLPIIALTAKAMRDDQERCIAAGASDYLAKPLDVEMLLSLLRVWMPRT